MKKLIRVVVVLVFLLIIGVLAAFYYVDTVAKSAVERGGSYALGVPTTLKKADVKPFAGAFAMNDLHVSNPEGYESKHFLTLGEGDVAVSLGSLMEDTVRLPHLTLADIDINMEKKDGKANYQAILDNLKKLSSDKPADPDAKKYVIETVDLRNIMVHVQMLGQNLDVPIDQITLKDVGSGGAGVDIGQLTGVVMKAVFEGVVQAGGGLIPTEMLGDLTQGLAGLADLDKLADLANVKAVGELANKATEAAQQAADEAGKAAEDLKNKADDLANKAKEGLGGILGGDKPKDDKPD